MQPLWGYSKLNFHHVIGCPRFEKKSGKLQFNIKIFKKFVQFPPRVTAKEILSPSKAFLVRNFSRLIEFANSLFNPTILNSIILKYSILSPAFNSALTFFPALILCGFLPPPGRIICANGLSRLLHEKEIHFYSPGPERDFAISICSFSITFMSDYSPGWLYGR